MGVMSEENVVQNDAGCRADSSAIASASAEANGVGESPQNDKTDAGRALTGKIARLPDDIRTEINLRILNGKSYPDILAWLNELPVVKEIIAAQFNAVPISPTNLSNWRDIGYERWLNHRENVGAMKEIAKEADDFAQTGGGNIARGAAAFASGKILRFLEKIPDKNATPEELINLATAVADLLKGEQNAVRLTISQERLRQHERRLILLRDKQQRDVVAVAFRVLGDARIKAFYDAPISNAEKIELIGLAIYGELWEPRPIPTDGISPPSPPSNGLNSQI
jgi:hypothetical protein